MAKRIIAIILAMCLGMSMGLQAFAETTVETETETTVEGEITTVVTTTTETTKEGDTTTVTITVETKKDGVDENGAIIDYDETKVNTTETVERPFNTVTTEKEVVDGTEITEAPNNDEIKINVMKDSKVSEDLTGSSETKEPETTGDLKSDNPNNYNQTTVTTEERNANVTVNEVSVSSGIPVYIDENGNIVGRADEGFYYYWSDIYTVDGKSIIDKEVPDTYWKTGGTYGYIVDAEGNRTQVHNEGVCQRVVAHDNGTTTDRSDDFEVGGLYCVDASTGIEQDLKYRRANLEDADYYSEDDIAHLREIMTYGYTWDDDTDSGMTNLQAIKDMIKDAQENGSPEVKELLKDMDVDNLTREQAATATGMAVWTFGNRFELEEGEYVEYVSRDGNAQNKARIETLYKYLCTLTIEEPKETQIINEEKFIDEFDMVIGGMVENNEANKDEDDTNDVYNVDVKFSLVVQPSADNDDLIVKVVDDKGNVVKTARIAGEQKENEDFEYAKTETDENGNLYYVLEGLELAENSNTNFNLKLEGTQLLENGVYIFESQKLSKEERIDQTIQLWKDYGELEYALADLGSMEAVREYIGKNYVDGIYESQNFIGKYQGEAEIGVSMKIDLSFNVEEGTVTTVREWHFDSDPIVENPRDPEDPEDPRDPYEPTVIDDDPTPLAPNPPAEQYDVPETETIVDEEVPLADVPGLGDDSAIWMLVAAFAVFSLVVITAPAKKRED